MKQESMKEENPLHNYSVKSHIYSIPSTYGELARKLYTVVYSVLSVYTVQCVCLTVIATQVKERFINEYR
jgi:hypothetical protein